MIRRNSLDLALLLAGCALPGPARMSDEHDALIVSEPPSDASRAAGDVLDTMAMNAKVRPVLLGYDPGYDMRPPRRLPASSVPAEPHGVAAALKAEAPQPEYCHLDMRSGWRFFKRAARKVRMARKRRRGFA